MYHKYVPVEAKDEGCSLRCLKNPILDRFRVFDPSLTATIILQALNLVTFDICKEI